MRLEQLLFGPDLATAAALDVANSARAKQRLVAAFRTAPECRAGRQVRISHVSTLASHGDWSRGVAGPVGCGVQLDRRQTRDFTVQDASSNGQRRGVSRV